MSQHISRQLGWLAAPLLLILASAPLFMMLFVLCGLVVGICQQIAILDPTISGAQIFSESLRFSENKLSAVAGRLVLNWIAVVSILIASLQTTIVPLFWSVARLSLVRILTMIHARLRH
jgi:hypothetical protein